MKDNIAEYMADLQTKVVSCSDERAQKWIAGIALNRSGVEPTKKAAQQSTTQKMLLPEQSSSQNQNSDQRCAAQTDGAQSQLSTDIGDPAVLESFTNKKGNLCVLMRCVQ